MVNKTFQLRNLVSLHFRTRTRSDNSRFEYEYEYELTELLSRKVSQDIGSIFVSSLSGPLLGSSYSMLCRNHNSCKIRSNLEEHSALVNVRQGIGVSVPPDVCLL
jgi:hypothetical protein